MFDSHTFLKELTTSFESQNDNNFTRSYGQLIGFMNVALASLNLSSEQINHLNKMLTVAKEK